MFHNSSRLFMGAILPLLFLLSANSASSTEGSATAIRNFSVQDYLPAQPFVVTIQVTPTAATTTWALEDSPPEGWTVSAISHQGAFDQVNKKVKFGPYFSNSAQTLQYVVTPSAGASGIASFNGVVSADGHNSQVTGRCGISSGCAVSEPVINEGAFATINISDVFDQYNFESDVVQVDPTESYSLEHCPGTNCKLKLNRDSYICDGAAASNDPSCRARALHESVCGGW